MRAFSFLLVVVFFVACSSNNDGYLQPRNLLEYGIPLTILAPDSVDISTKNFIVYDEITIKSQSSDDYNVLIYSSELEASSTVGGTKAKQVEQLKSSFSNFKVLTDEEDGFVYETVIDSTLHSYGFRRVVIQGDKEFIFQTGYGSFTKEQAEEMYKSTVPQAMKKK